MAAERQRKLFLSPEQMKGIEEKYKSLPEPECVKKFAIFTTPGA